MTFSNVYTIYTNATEDKMKRILPLIAAFALLTGCNDQIIVTDVFGEQPVR